MTRSFEISVSMKPIGLPSLSLSMIITSLLQSLYVENFPIGYTVAQREIPLPVCRTKPRASPNGPRRDRGAVYGNKSRSGWTGICEIAGAAGLLLPEFQRAAGYALIAFFLAVLPANIRAARAGVTLRGKPATTLWLRIPMQVLFIAVAFWSAR
jgi:hypothetical protein